MSVLTLTYDPQRPGPILVTRGHARIFAPGWRRAPALVGWAAAVAVMMSTEFLFQLFVWRNFDVSQIAWAWLAIARDRLVVAGAIAAALVLAGEPRGRGPFRFARHTLAVMIGAAAGEALLSWVSPLEDRQDVVSWIGRVLRWSVVGGAIAVMLSLWRSGAELATAAEESRITAADTRRLAAISELEFLRRQIEPHFLFNTLATIRRLHDSDPGEGRRLLDRLFQVMTATLGSQASPSTLGDEIDLVCAYLDVCAARMGGRLRVLTEVEPDLRSMAFPPLILATLAENAVKHGVFPRSGGEIRVRALKVERDVEIAVIDDGAGLGGDGVTAEWGGGGMGLANTLERLRLLHGPRAELRLRDNHPRGVRAVVRVPAP